MYSHRLHLCTEQKWTITCKGKKWFHENQTRQATKMTKSTHMLRILVSRVWKNINFKTFNGEEFCYSLKIHVSHMVKWHNTLLDWIREISSNPLYTLSFFYYFEGCHVKFWTIHMNEQSILKLLQDVQYRSKLSTIICPNLREFEQMIMKDRLWVSMVFVYVCVCVFFSYRRFGVSLTLPNRKKSVISKKLFCQTCEKVLLFLFQISERMSLHPNRVRDLCNSPSPSIMHYSVANMIDTTNWRNRGESF